MWTQQHDQYCLENSIPPAAKLLWQWLLSTEEIGTETEPDLSEFQSWVEKHRGKKYAHHYLKKMFDLLVEKRVIEVVKKFSWKIFRLLVRPLNWLKPNKEKKLQNPKQSYKTQPSNPDKSVDKDIQQQLISNQELLANEQLHFDIKEKEVLYRPQWQIKVAILLYKIRKSTSEIINPEGWIRTCLRREYWEQPNNFGAIAKHFGGVAMDVQDYFS
jgi:hypothetical protein